MVACVSDVAVLDKPPDREAVRRWLVAWRPVRFRHRGRWLIGIVKVQAQLQDGRWVLLIEHASDGMHDGWSAMLWAVHDGTLIVPLQI